MKKLTILLAFAGLLLCSCDGYTWLIKPQYNDAWSFNDGLARVENNRGYWAYIDEKNEVIIDSLSEYADLFFNGDYSLHIKGKYGSLDENKYFRHNSRQEDTDLYTFRSGNRWGFKNNKGIIIVPAMYEDVYMHTDGLARVLHKGKWGFIDEKGEFVIPAEYDRAWSFMEGYAIVSKDGKWGVINTTGDYLVPLQYDQIYKFDDGIAPCVKNGKYGYVTLEGKELVEPKYDDVFHFSEGYGIIEQDGICGYINTKGEVIIEPTYTAASEFYYGKIAVVGDGEKFFCIDPTGKMLTQKYDRIYEFADERGIIQLGDKYGMIDTEGKVIFEPEFDDLFDSRQGHSILQQGELYGLVDRDGKILIEPQYENIGSYSCKVVPVQIGDKWGYIDRNNKTVVEPIFDWAWSPNDEGIALVYMDGKYGYINVGKGGFKFAWNKLARKVNAMFA